MGYGSDFDRRARELAWEMFLLKDWNLEHTEKYRKLKEQFNKAVNTSRRLRGLPPLESKDEQK